MRSLPIDLRDTLQSSLGTAVTIEAELRGAGPWRVFVARNVTLGQEIVVKALAPDVAAGVNAERFAREIAPAERLQYSHIIPLLSTGATTNGVPYFTMRFVDGESLRARIARDGELPLAEAIGLLRGVASALAYAHGHGIMHGDLGPDNVFVSNGSAAVTEFGVARALAASTIAATGPATAEPTVDHRTDIYAFGVLAYELLAGRAPFAGRTPLIGEQPAPIQARRPTLPPELATLIMQCLEKRPGDRPQTAAGVVRALDDTAAPSDDFALASLWPVESPTLAARSLQFRNRLVVTLVTVTVLFAAAAVFQWRWANRLSGKASVAAAPEAPAVLPLDGATHGSPSSTARDLYLRGRMLQAKHTEPDLRESLVLFHSALTEDPKFALAWSGIADSWDLLSDDFVAPRDAESRMREAVARGLAIDSSVAELRFTQGLIAYRFNRDARAAQWYMSGALGVNPDLTNGTTWYPQVLWANGLRDSAAAFLRHAVERDSTSAHKLSDAWMFAHLAGNSTEARRYCGRLIELRAGERCDALEQLDIDRPEAAMDVFQRAVKDPGVRKLNAELAYVSVLVAAGHASDARTLVADVDRQAATPGQYTREDDVALMHGMIGDNDGAMMWYERALSSGSSGMGSLYWGTVANPVRKDPRVLALAKRAGLQSPPFYWP